MFSMAVTTTDIIAVMAAFAICFIIAEIAKWHVRTSCMDNPEIIWIWLDEEDEPHGGQKVKNGGPENRMHAEPDLTPRFQGI